MKRIFSILLAICLSVSAFTALSEYALTPLDTPEGAEGYRLNSLSPDGRKALLIDMANSSALIVDRETGERVSVWLDFDNSVEDTYGNLANVGRVMNSSLIANWSPDGRYIAITDWRGSMLMMRTEYDLFVIDTQTGALRDYHTYANKVIEDDFGAVIAARFSQDSQTLYYTLYGNQSPYCRVTLNRLDMQTGECEELHRMGRAGVFCAWQDLCITPDGALVGLLNAGSRDELVGLYTVNRVWHGWQGEDKFIDKSVNDNNMFEPTRLFISPVTGLGAIQYALAGVLRILSVFDCASDYDKFDEVLAFRSLEPGTAERITFDEWAKCLDTNDNMSPTLFSLADIYLCAISPDGTRAILFMSYSDNVDDAREYALVVLDMNTLAYEPVSLSGLDLSSIVIGNALIRDIVWAGGDIIILTTREGDRVMYKLSE